jgi:hypothetical protein
VCAWACIDTSTANISPIAGQNTLESPSKVDSVVGTSSAPSVSSTSASSKGTEAVTASSIAESSSETLTPDVVDNEDPDLIVLGFQEVDLSTEALMYANTTEREDAWCT